MPDLSVEKKFAILCEITRAQHFAWREAVAELCPGVDTTEVVKRMWELTGAQTGAAYLKRVDPEKPLAPQIAASIVWSSQCMGEDAALQTGEGGEAFVEHSDCPWKHWHEKQGLLAEDRPGCDAWFQATVDTVNGSLGSKLEVETLSTLPDGDACCRRRFSVRGAE
jgi:hypothetical protein